MKAVTEFPGYLLLKGLASKATLATDGKTPEEIEQNLGEVYKFENPKLKYFVSALSVAEQNSADLKRILVIGVGENETAPAKSVKVDEHYYLPEFIVAQQIKPQDTTGVKSPRRGGGPGGKKDGPKSSPWGLSPEEKAAKNKGAVKK